MPADQWTMESGIPLKTTKAGTQDVMRATMLVGADGIPASSPVIEKDIIKDLQEPGPPRSCKFRASVLKILKIWGLPLDLIFVKWMHGRKAWIAAEELSLSKLGADSGVQYLESWITARFLDLEITRIGRALSDFFRRLRRRQGQTVREYNTEYDRLYGRLREVGCCLPEECAAWVYLDRLQLEEPQELNLLASVGNKYDLLRLQQAAVLHDRGRRKPWESNAAKGRRTNYANMTDEVDHDDPDDETGNLTDGEEGIPEEVAQAWMTFRSAKDKYKAQQRNRGYQGDGERPRDRGGEPTLKQMKLKSFCSGCGRRGHWHKDPECPNNQGATAGTKAGGGNDGGGQSRGGKDPAREVAMTTVLPASICALKHEGHSLMAVTDTACARTVAGTQWLQSYTDLLADQGERPALHKENEAYRFGTGKVHVSTFYIVVCFELGNKIVKVRTSIITGDVPLLLSKTVLGKLGMVFDVEKGKADFNKVGLTDYMLLTTPSGHPAIPIVPAKAGTGGTCTLQIDDLRLEPREAYMDVFALAYQGPNRSQHTGIYQPKKLDPTITNLLSEDSLAQDPFFVWWKSTTVDRDFWLETVSLNNQHIRNFGLEELSFTRRPENLFLIPPLRAMSSEPCQGPPPPISKMTKTQLLAESSRLGLVVHTSWTVEELRAIIREHRESKTMQDGKVAMRGLSSLTMPELKVKATELKVDFPEQHHERQPLEAHKGKEYQEVPDAYGRWAVDEVNGNSNSSADLVRFAKWWHKNNGPRADAELRARGHGGPAAAIPEGERGPTSLARVSGELDHISCSRPKASHPPVGVGDGSGHATQEDRRAHFGELGGRIVGSGVGSLHQDWAREGQRQDDQAPPGDLGQTHGERDRPGGARGDPGAPDEAGPVEGQGQEQQSVSYEERPGALPQRLACTDGGRCCAEIYEQEIITDEAFSRAYSQAEDVYANTHHEPQTDLCGGDGESTARIAYKEGDFTYARCQQVLDAARLPRRALRAMNDPAENDQDTAYVTLGVFVHGGVRGITTATKEYNSLVRYLNGFARHHLQRGCKWSSISVTKNIASTVHRDSHNMRGSNNHCVTLGQDGGGELWIESPGLTENEAKLNEIEWKLDKSGAWTPGQCFDTRENFVTFDPFLRHASKPWEGDRWGLVYHTVRGADEISEAMDKFIRNSGFPNTHSSITNAAGKTGVLMTTLIVAANSYMTEICGPPPAPSPIVMMEIGGYEGTVEATELDKAVLEPMSWDDLKDSDLQETAHHFVIGASPKELRIHLRDMPAGCFSFAKELIRTQLDEGGEVVLRGEVPGNLTDDFKEDVSFFTSGDEDSWMILRKAKKGQKPLQGPHGLRPHEVQAVHAEDRPKEPHKLDGSGITFDKEVAAHVQSSLRRLHQNLGHPRKEDLLRHLRLAGCEPHIWKAVKGMKFDLFYVHDINDKRHTFLSMVDWATTYHVVCRMESETAEDVEKAFNKMWLGPFGPPTMVSLDLDPKIQSGMSRLCDWHTIRVKDVAAQAHWQAGVTERQGGWFKGIWDRVVQELSVAEDEVELAGALVCAAKNDLRRRCGHSPSQWVFGKSPRLPPELNDLDSGEAVSWDLTRDSQFQRATAIRASARVAFHKAQGDDRLRRALLQRARPAQRDFDIGDPVHYWDQPKDRRRARWLGPGVVVGRQGGSYWISRNGKCRLTAPEHVRASGPEEIGEFLTMKGVKREVEKLLAEDIDDPDMFDNDEPEEDVTKKATPDNEDYSDHLSDYEPSDYDNGITLDGALPDDGQQSDTPMPDLVPPAPPSRRLKRKTRVEQKDRGGDEVMMLRRDLTKRGHAKRQEKELLPDPSSKKPNGNNGWNTSTMTSVEESDRVRATVPPSRILRSRWAYKDKNWAARQAGNDPEWRCKSRLIIGGHLDPDLGEKDLTTDAPTLSRPGFMCLMQLLANGQHAQDVWEVAAGDIQCAFLTGGYLNRDEPLYLHQPTTGFPGLLPQQLVKIKKNIFGLATSPHEWWEDLQKGIKRTPITYNGRTYGWDQCPLDPCIFMLREYDNGKFHGKPIGYLGTHVDDILVVAAKSVSDLIKDALSRTFPIDKWEVNRLDYIGSEIVVENGEVKVSQTKYVETRLFTIDIPRGVCEEDLADPETAADNKSLIGALSWLSAQTRPDLTCGVSISQQLQKSPTYGDVKFTNVVASRAMSYKHHGLVFRGIDPGKAAFMVYHDAAWANVLEENEPGFELTEEDYRAGLQLEGPYSKKERKAKRINSKVASQIGALVLIADIESVRGGRGNMSVSDWKSRAGQRVCRSTFGAETQASVEGLEAAQYMRSFFETVIKGELVKVECATTPLLCLSDCRSLYDHIHKEGLPRVASDRRLAIDLAALRQGLRWERWYPKLLMAWVPSALQLADVLTKPKDPHDWWDMMCSRLTVAIEVGEQSRANILKEGEEVTSVEHKVSSGTGRTVHFLSDCSYDELH
ncbi:GIP [Symbiodinium sp. CCMP2592]|nr:GIP [Symbiodinium sp. CCMP2592]